MIKLKQFKPALSLTACLVLSQTLTAHADLPKSAALYYPAPQVVNVTPYFDYFITDRSNNLYNYKTENHSTGVLLDYGINSIISVGGKLSYGEENSSQSHILTARENSVSSKGLSDPEFYLSTRYNFEKFRVYGNIFGHISMENHKTSSTFDNGNLASGGPSADLELATDTTLGPVTTGLLAGKTIWKDLRQISDNSNYTKYQLKGAEFEKYKVFFELNSLNNLKPGLIYTFRKTNPSKRLLENSNQEILFDYGQNDTAFEIYSRYRVAASLIIIGSVSQIDSVSNPDKLNEEAYKSYGLNLGLTLKY